MKASVNLIFIGTLFVCVHTFSTREFNLEEVGDDEPDHSELAAVARYVVHKSEWTAMGTISAAVNRTSYPMVNLKSIADSAKGEPSTGVIYFYLTISDFTAQDLVKDNRLTVLFSNDQDLACTNKGIDPMEPNCARIIISGSAVKLDFNSDEYKFGNRAFVSRHPAAETWIKHHNFYLCKIEISQITVLDWHDGPHNVNAKDYYNVKDGTVNGFLKKSNQNTRKRFALNKNDEKIRIRVQKGDESIFLDL